MRFAHTGFRVSECFRVLDVLEFRGHAQHSPPPPILIHHGFWGFLVAKTSKLFRFAYNDLSKSSSRLKAEQKWISCWSKPTDQIVKSIYVSNMFFPFCRGGLTFTLTSPCFPPCSPGINQTLPNLLLGPTYQRVIASELSREKHTAAPGWSSDWESCLTDGFELFILLGDMDITWSSFQRSANEQVEVFFLGWTANFRRRSFQRLNKWTWNSRCIKIPVSQPNFAEECVLGAFLLLIQQKVFKCLFSIVFLCRFSMCLPDFGIGRFMMIIRAKSVASSLSTSMIVFSMGTDKCNDIQR